MKKLRKKIGDFVKVPFSDGEHTYARVLKHSFFAFYRIKTTKDLSLDEISQLDIHLNACVINNPSPISSKRWEIIGYKKIKDTKLFYQKYFRPDFLFKTKYYVSDNLFSEERIATFNEVKDMEISMVWICEDIEKRLMDELSGRKHKAYEEKHLEFLLAESFLSDKKFDVYRDITKASENKDYDLMIKLVNDHGIKKMVSDLDKNKNND